MKDEIEKKANEFVDKYIKDLGLTTCFYCHAKNCIYNKNCIKCDKPLIKVD